jgi:hypothetical protein
MVELKLEVVKKGWERRWFSRFDTQYKAQYLFKNNQDFNSAANR